MSAVWVPPGQQNFFGQDGKPASLGTVELYIPNTLTDKLSWADEAQTVSNTNPIALDASGAASIWGTGLYRMIVKDQSEVLIFDKVTGFISATESGNVVGPDSSFTGNIAVFADTTGKQLADGGPPPSMVTAIPGSGNVATILNANLAGALAAGVPLIWPIGAYTATSNLPNLSSVVNIGRGTITDGTTTFYPDCRPTVVNNLFVAIGGSDANDGISSARPLATVNQALVLIGDYGGGCAWVINVGPGHFAATTLTVNLNARRVSIIGTSSQQTVTAASETGGSAGAYTVSHTLNAMGGAVVGDWLIVRNPVGTGAKELLQGLFKITGVTGAVITSTCYVQSASFPAAALTGGDAYVLRSVLNFANQDGVRVYSSVHLGGLAIVGSGNAGTYGVIGGREDVDNVAITERVTFSNDLAAGIASFDVGSHIQTASKTSSLGICITNCITYGALAQHVGAQFLIGAILNGNIGQGASATNSGDLWLENAFCCGNGANGVYLLAGGSGLVKQAVMTYNVLNGIIIERGASGRGGSGAIYSHNGNSGIYSQGGNFYAVGDTGVGNSTHDILCDSHGRVEAAGGNFADLAADEHSYIDGRNITAAVTAFAGVLSEINVGGVAVVTFSTPAVNTLGAAGTGNAGGYVRA